MRVTLQSAFVLHSRPYGDTSVIVDIFAEQYGRMSLLVKGQRHTQARNRKPLVTFAVLLLSWQGRSDLKTLISAEISKSAPALVGERLYCGFYLNELLTRLLPLQDPHPRLFEAYAKLLDQLVSAEDVEPSLRQFEILLLNELGYGLPFDSDAESGEAVVEDSWYNFVADSGFVKIDSPSPEQQRQLFSGATLIALADNDYSALETRQHAKKLTRMALQPHLGNRPLKSRELFSKQR